MIKRELTPVWHGLTLLMLLIVAAWARVRVTMLDFNSLLTSYLADDAFYYYKIAANVSNLHRITYDGEQLSNGFHPLWLALITPFYTSANEGIDFVYRVQWIMFCCSLLTVVALYCTLSRLRTGWLCTVIITAIFCVHSTFIDMQINGLETSLNSLILLLLFNAFLTVFLKPEAGKIRYVYYGFISSIAFMTRTDNGLALLILFACLVWEARHDLRRSGPKILLSGLVALVVSSPWLIWNQIHFDSFVQSSGKVETIFWGEPQYKWGVIGYSLFLAPVRIYEKMANFYSLFMAYGVSSPVLTGFFSIGWMVLLLVGVLASCGRVTVKALLYFCIAVISVLLYHIIIRNFVRIWYYVPVGLVYLLAGAAFFVLLKSFLQKHFERGFIHLIPEAGLLLWLGSVLWLYSPNRLPDVVAEQSQHLVVAEWINGNLPSDAIVGSMNSGILSYLVHRKVVNLDGVVDQRSMQAFWKKNHHAYILERDISYLVDNDGALAIFCGEARLYTCVPVFTFGDKRNPSRVARVLER